MRKNIRVFYLCPPADGSGGAHSDSELLAGAPPSPRFESDKEDGEDLAAGLLQPTKSVVTKFLYAIQVCDIWEPERHTYIYIYICIYIQYIYIY